MTPAFKPPRFYPILDTTVLAARQCGVMVVAQALIAAGIKILQYRHKENWEQIHFDEAKRLSEMCQAEGVLFVMNDRADFAKLLRTALHIGQDDLSPVAARQLIADEVMGFSTHNGLQLKRGDKEPVEYLSLGPIFATGSKLRPDPVVGLDGLRTLRALTTKPLIAIGGITLENAPEAFEAKADSVAVISGILPEICTPTGIRTLAEAWLKV